MKTVLSFFLIAVCTVVMYYLLFDEYSTLFYVNICIACVTESIFCLSLPILTNKRLLTFKRAASQYVLTAYAIFAFLWVTIYTLSMSESYSIKSLYIGLLLISIVFIFLLIALEVGGDAMQKQEKVLQTTILAKKQGILSLDEFWLEVKNELCNHSDWEDETLKMMRSILDKVASIPAEKWECNEDIVEKINEKLSKLSDAILAVGNVEDVEKRQIVTRQLNHLRNYIVTLKSTL
ncbi:hypothetical protein [uncultured Bacteroides sp.]|uniref:hypothetical protein n=1 Tax=uncultured Bacteroides sp. TaxID=162156 RepID=UPI0025FF0E92|nr:hypothetical protein [uncultured Bacteroides sp.]